MQEEQILEEFKTPPMHWRPMPLWVWNNDMTEARIDTMLDDFLRAGMGGVYIHPRPGLITEYLSDSWFRLWRYAADRCRNLGLYCEIYDENSYPSGFAGGHVVASNPETITWYVKCSRLETPIAPTERVLCCSQEDGTPLPADAWQTASPETPVLCYTHETPRGERWMAGFPRPDITRRETTQAFLDTTHRAYGQALGEHMGSTTRYAFTDEPTIYRHISGVYYTDHLRRAFKNDHGYDLADCLASLFVDCDNNAQVRHDYYFTCNRLVCTNYYQAIHDACEELSIGFTGHIDEHLWPMPSGNPSVMAALRWMHVPGNDLLAPHFTVDNPQQLYMRIMRLNLHQLDSIATQCGREQRLTESCGAGGYHYNPNHMKPLEDVLLAFGVNQMNPHLAYATCVGTRKMDYPQTISDHSPWLDDYRDQADHVARVCAALSLGTPAPKRLLLISPDTSGWLLHHPTVQSNGCLGYVGYVNGANPKMDALRNDFLELIEALDASQIDYDIGDECVMAELASVGDGRCTVGACTYDAVILPGCLCNLETTTCNLLESLMDSGGTCYLEGETLPPLIDGRPSARLQTWLASVRSCAEREALIRVLRETYPPYITAPDGGALPRELFWRNVITPQGMLFFLCNPWPDALSCELRLPGKGLQELDTATGAARPCVSTVTPEGQTIHLQLSPGGHALLLCTENEDPVPVVKTDWQTATVAVIDVTTSEQNLLVLDHARLYVDDKLLCTGQAAYCDTRLWQAQGFDCSPWDRSIQFKQCILNRDYSETRPFRVEYDCLIDPSCDPDTFCLCVERPALWEITINGQVCKDSGEVYFDENMRRIPCGNLLQSGENRIVLTRETLAPHCELAPLWLLGDHRLDPREKGFALLPPQPLSLGDLGEQGMPLYRGNAVYTATLTCPQAATQLHLTDWAWDGVCVRVEVDGVMLGRLWNRQATLTLACDLSAGDHTLTLTIVGDLGNCMGPHHLDAGHASPWTLLSRGACDRPPEGECPPPGASYRRQAHGLKRLPHIAFR